MLELVWKFIFCPITWVTFLAIAIFLQINGGKNENGKEDKGNVFNNMLIEEAMYSGSWSVNMIAYYCWMLNQRVISVKNLEILTWFYQLSMKEYFQMLHTYLTDM